MSPDPQITMAETAIPEAGRHLAISPTGCRVDSQWLCG